MDAHDISIICNVYDVHSHSDMIRGCKKKIANLSCIFETERERVHGKYKMAMQEWEDKNSEKK